MYFPRSFVRHQENSTAIYLDTKLRMFAVVTGLCVEKEGLSTVASSH